MKKTFEQLGARKQDKILLELWAKCVKIRAKFKCEFRGCSKTFMLNAHHVYSRSNYNVRYDTENGACLCSCHHSLCNNSAHKSPLEFADMMIQIRGQEWFDRLRKKALTDRIKYDKVKIKENLEAELKRLRGE